MDKDLRHEPSALLALGTATEALANPASDVEAGGSADATVFDDYALLAALLFGADETEPDR